MQEKDPVAEFQEAFSAFMATQTGKEGAVIDQFVLFYLAKDGARSGGGVIQSFEDVMQGIAYALHTCSVVLRKHDSGEHKLTAYLVGDGEVKAKFDLKEGNKDYENEPN